MASESVKRSLKEGIGFGIIAGIVFLIAEMIAASVMGNGLDQPFRMFSSIVLGREAMMSSSLGTIVVVGSVVHVVLSGLFGLIYGGFVAQMGTDTQLGWGRQIGLGLLFGLAVWLVNFQIIARVAFPWFLEAPQVLQAALHAVFFGLPLTMMYVAAERRARGLHAVPQAA